MKQLIVLMLIIISIMPAFAQEDEAACGLESRLQLSAVGQVIPGPANNLRNTPSTDGERIGQIPGSETFFINGEVICSEGFTWLMVEYEGLTGWTVEATTEEYFLASFEIPSLTFDDVSFDLPNDIASEFKGEFVEAELPTEDAPWRNAPEYLEFTFRTYADRNHREFDPPTIRIYKITAFDGIENMLGGAGRFAVADLITMLKERPNLDSFDVFSNRIPDDTPGAAASTHAFFDYMDFQNGSGIHFVTYYAQAFVGVNNQALMYRYIGITNDGQYFVSVRLPIEVADLSPEFAEFIPEDETAPPFEEFSEFSQEVATYLDSLPTNDYTPNLISLNALVQSLQVGTEVE